MASVDMQGAQFDIEGWPSQPLTRHIAAVATVAELQGDMALVRRYFLRDKLFHGKAQNIEQSGRRPVQRLPNRVGICQIRLDA